MSIATRSVDWCPNIPSSTLCTWTSPHGTVVGRLSSRKQNSSHAEVTQSSFHNPYWCRCCKCPWRSAMATQASGSRWQRCGTCARAMWGTQPRQLRHARASCSTLACCLGKIQTSGRSKGGPRLTCLSRISCGALLATLLFVFCNALPIRLPACVSTLLLHKLLSFRTGSKECCTAKIRFTLRQGSSTTAGLKGALYRRTIKTTEIAWGTALKLYLKPALYDARLTGVYDSAPAGQPPSGHTEYKADLDYSRHKVEVEDEAAWKAAIADQPLPDAARRAQAAAFMAAKMVGPGVELQREGLHGVWELATRPDYQQEMTHGALAACRGPSLVLAVL